MKNLDELVKEYGMSRMTFQRRMKLIPNFKERFCKRGKYNKLYITDEGIKKINYPKHDSTSGSFAHKKGSNPGQTTSADKSRIINQLLYLNHRLMSDKTQLAKKNRALSEDNRKQMKLGYHEPTAETDLKNEQEENQKLKEIVNKQGKLLDSYSQRPQGFFGWLKHLLH